MHNSFEIIFSLLVRNYNSILFLNRYHYVRKSSRLVRYNTEGHLAICWADEWFEGRLDVGMG